MQRKTFVITHVRKTYKTFNLIIPSQSPGKIQVFNFKSAKSLLFKRKRQFRGKHSKGDE